MKKLLVLLALLALPLTAHAGFFDSLQGIYQSGQTFGGYIGTINKLPISTFLGLTDTPSSYSSSSEDIVRVNTGETGIEFVDDTSDFLTQYIINAPTTDTRNVIQPTDAAVKGLVIKGASSQSDNLQEWQNSIGTVLSKVTSAGELSINTSSSAALLVEQSGVHNNVFKVDTTNNKIYIPGGAYIDSNPVLYGWSSGIVWPGGSKLIEQRASPEGTDRMIYNPNGDSFDVLNESGTLFIASFHGASASQYASRFQSFQPVYISGTAGSPSASLHVKHSTNTTQILSEAPSATSKPIVLKGAVSQSANLTEWQNSSGNVLAGVNKDGTFLLNGDSLYNKLALAFTDDLTTGIYQAETGQFTFYAGGSSSFTAKGGGVLNYISWRAPATGSQLNVKGAVTSESTDDAFYVTNERDLRTSATAKIFSVYAYQSGSTNYGERLSMYGNGLSKFTGKIEVDAGTSTTVAMLVKGADSQSANLQEWQDSSGTVLGAIDASGNLGVGTSTPSSILHVEKASATSTVTIGGVGSISCLKLRDSDDGGWSYATVLNGVMSVSTTSCE